MSYVVIGYIPEHANRLDNLPVSPLSGNAAGVHTPLRQDGVYGSVESAQSVVDLWRANPADPRERVVMAKLIEELGASH